MNIVRLKKDVPFKTLKEYGFVEDDANCEPGDHYYHGNNYYLEKGDFRITVNMHDRHIDILCLAKETGVHNIFEVKPLFDLFTSGLVEVPNLENDQKENVQEKDTQDWDAWYIGDPKIHVHWKCNDCHYDWNGDGTDVGCPIEDCDSPNIVVISHDI